MALYPYSCGSCSRSFEVSSEPGGPAPAPMVPCQACGQPADRVWGVGLSVQARNQAWDYTTVGAQPIDSRVVPGRRNARQVHRDAEKLIGAKARLARRARRDRGTSRARGCVRQIGSIDVRELNAIKAQTGNKNIVRDEGIESVLKRAGKHFDHL